jgi:hypothetical protein
MTEEPHPTGFSSCLWCDLRFSVCRGYSPSFENEFVDAETFSDDVLEVQATHIESVAATAADTEAGPSQASASKDRASLEFTKDLEQTVQKDGDLVKNPSLVEKREELPKGQDPSPSVATYNENFGTSFRGKLLSVRGEVVDSNDGAPRLSLLWMSPEFVNETGEDVPKKKLRLIGKTPSTVEKHTFAVEKHTSSSLQKSLTISEPGDEIPLRRLNPTGLHIASIFLYSGDLLTSLKFFVIFGFMSFVVFEENARKLSSSGLASFKKTYDLKASSVGKVVSERLLEKEELIGNFLANLKS